MHVRVLMEKIQRIVECL